MVERHDKQLLTLPGNLAVMRPEDTTEDIPSIQVEQSDRTLKLFLDGEMGIDYAYGRVLLVSGPPP